MDDCRGVYSCVRVFPKSLLVRQARIVAGGEGSLPDLRCRGARVVRQDEGREEFGEEDGDD